MAFTNFYLINGGTGAADNNAGSTIGAVAYTTVNGNWSSVTSHFIPTDGSTPANSIAAGDYCSVYVDNATVTTYVAKVVSVGAGINGLITLDTTIIYGTAPSTSVTARSLKAGGSWATEQVLAAGGLATTTVPQSTKINIALRGDTNPMTVAASRTISMAGATTTPLWFDGYSVNPNDLDNDTTNALQKPAWSFSSTFLGTFSGAFQIWSNIDFRGNRSGTIISVTGANQDWVRCRVLNNSSNASAIAITQNANTQSFRYCWFKTSTSATTTGTVSITGTVAFIGCIAEGGGLAGFNCATATASFINCIALNNTGNGWQYTTGVAKLAYCTVYNSTSDGIKWTGTPNVANTHFIVGCLFAICGGIGINQSTGTNSGVVTRACNDFYSCSGGNEVGFGDVPAFYGQTDSASPVVSSTDLTPIAGSNAISNGFPGVFEGGGALGSQVNHGQDVGAVQKLGSSYVPQVME